MNQRRLFMASLLLAVLLAACASPTPTVAPTEVVKPGEAVEPTEDAAPGVADTPTTVVPADAPAAGAATPTLIYFHASW